MKIFSAKQLTIKEIWLTALQLYYKTFPHVWPQAFAMGLVTVLTAVLTTNMSCQLQVNALTSTSIMCLFIYVISTLLMLYFGALLLYRIYVIGEEQNIALCDSIIFVGKKYLQIVAGLLLVLFISLLGMLAFILPGIFLLVLFFMVQPLILFDNQGCFSALKGSCKLVWHNWWRTFAVIFPILLLNYLLGLAASFLLTNFYLLLVGAMLFSVVVYPLFYTCILVQFGDLKFRYHANEDI